MCHCLSSRGGARPWSSTQAMCTWCAGWAARLEPSSSTELNSAAWRRPISGCILNKTPHIYINTYIPDWKLLRKLLEFFFLQYLYYLQFIRTQYWPRRVRLVSNCLLWETHKPHALSYNSCSTRTASTLSTKTYSRDETTCFIKCHLLYIPESPYLSPLKVICGFLFNKSLHAVNWKQSYWCYQACITSASERKF